LNKIVNILANYKLLCKNIDIIDELVNVSCICADKTGTITENKLVVAKLWYDGRIYKA
jgi:sodium/potassium-transporting ATPase subunit alpha